MIDFKDKVEVEKQMKAALLILQRTKAGLNTPLIVMRFLKPEEPDKGTGRFVCN